MRRLNGLRNWLQRSVRPSHDDLDASRAAQDLLDQLSAHDPLTGQHVNRVACVAAEIGLMLNLPPERMQAIEIGARLHDIGKLDVPDSILAKSGPLTDAEWAVIHRHPLSGGELLRSIPVLAPAADTVAAHHERWDGTGYPRGLATTAIPLDARIFAIADSIDAMRSDRPYRRGMPWEDVRAELVAGTGSQWDPDLCAMVVEQFDRIIALDGGCQHGFAAAA